MFSELALCVSLIIFAYLIGSICSAILISKLMGLEDPRSSGSSNPGATNVLRLSGKFPAALTLAGDLIKAVIPILIAKLLGAGVISQALVMLAAVLGHMFPVFFKFKGGKGVATTLGGLLALDLKLGGLFIISWLTVLAIWRYSSLAALTSLVVVSLYGFWLNFTLGLILACLTGLIFWRHQANIKKLFAGTESKVSF